MTIITNKTNATQVRFSNNVEKTYSQIDDKFYYKLELPVVLCDNEVSAKAILADINSFVNKRISQELKSLEVKEPENVKPTIVTTGKFSDILDKMDRIRKEETK